ncbi:MAG: NAD(P)H-dependent oxidoreductase [Flavobacteriaceae bacterium]|nr:NAD(P)H-dependent oxidoreductase [Flavobacteriaceae bacterium]
MDTQTVSQSLIESLEWRYATKKFDASKKIPTETLETLKTALQLTASSYGLQAYKIFIIENPEIRQKLLPFSWNQNQIVDASQVLVFANQLEIGDADVDAYINNASQTRNVPVEKLKPYADFMKANIKSVPAEAKAFWNAKQTYIVLGNLLTAAAALKIDVCPMEGFDPAAYDEILGLKALGLTAAVVAPVGYRSDEDATAHLAKVRKPKEELFVTL